MKLCVTSQGNSLDSPVDPRFGRCRYFILIDPDTSRFEAFENPNVDVERGAGIQSAQFVVEKGAGTVISVRVGPKAFQALESAGIPVITDAEGSVRETIDKFKNSEMVPASGPNSAGRE